MALHELIERLTRRHNVQTEPNSPPTVVDLLPYIQMGPTERFLQLAGSEYHNGVTDHTKRVFGEYIEHPNPYVLMFHKGESTFIAAITSEGQIISLHPKHSNNKSQIELVAHHDTAHDSVLSAAKKNLATHPNCLIVDTDNGLGIKSISVIVPSSEHSGTSEANVLTFFLNPYDSAQGVGRVDPGMVIAEKLHIPVNTTQTQ